MKFDFRSESFRRKISIILFDHNLIIRCSWKKGLKKLLSKSNPGLALIWAALNNWSSTLIIRLAYFHPLGTNQQITRDEHKKKTTTTTKQKQKQTKKMVFLLPHLQDLLDHNTNI